MRRFVSVVVGALVIAALPAGAAQAVTVAGAGTIPNPWIPEFCGPSFTADQSFHLAARGSGSGQNQPASGSITFDTVDLLTCTPVTVHASVQCLLGVSGNQAVAWGPVTGESQPTPDFNYVNVLIQDNHPSADTGSINGQYWNPAPGDCADVGYTPFYYPFTRGGATVTP